MPQLLDTEKILFNQAKKKFAKHTIESSQLGKITLGTTRLGRQTAFLTTMLTPGIYQKRTGQYGSYTVRTKFYRPANPRTSEQQAWRMKFKAAMESWQSLSTNVKYAYNKEARSYKMTGHNLYISRTIHTF